MNERSCKNKAKVLIPSYSDHTEAVLYETTEFYPVLTGDEIKVMDGLFNGSLDEYIQIGYDGEEQPVVLIRKTKHGASSHRYKLEANIEFDWISMAVINCIHSSNIVYLFLVQEIVSRKCHLLGYCLIDGHLVEKANLQIDNVPCDECILKLHTDVGNQIYLIHHFRLENGTAFSCAQVAVDDGAIELNTVYDKLQHSGQWMFPFIYEGAIQLVSNNKSMDQLLSYNLRLDPDQSAIVTRIKKRNRDEYGEGIANRHFGGTWQHYALFCLIFGSDDDDPLNRRNVIVALDMEKMEWLLCSVITAHSVFGKLIVSYADELISVLTLIGDCMDTDCAKCHEYTFKLQTVKNAASMQLTTKIITNVERRLPILADAENSNAEQSADQAGKNEFFRETVLHDANVEESKRVQEENLLKFLKEALSLVRRGNSNVELCKQLGVDCNFDELFFMDGIATDCCYCYSSDSSKIIGYDDNARQLVAIDLGNDFTKTIYQMPDNNARLQSGKWKSMISIGTVAREKILACITVNENNDVIVTCSFVNGHVQIDNEIEIKCNEVNSNVTQRFATHIYFLQDSTLETYLIRFFNKMHAQHGSTELMLAKILIDDSGNVKLEFIYNSLDLPELWNCPTIHAGKLYLFNKSVYKTEQRDILVVPIDKEGVQKVEYITNECHLSTNRIYQCQCLGCGADELYFLIANYDSNSNILVSLDLNRRVMRSMFELKKHAINSRRILCDRGKLLMNGRCIDVSCDKWHCYHFNLWPRIALPQPMMQIKTGRNLYDISAILSTADVTIIHGAERHDLVLMWIIRQLCNQNLKEVKYTVYVSTSAKRALYTTALESLNIKEGQVEIASFNPDKPEIDFENDAPIVVDSLTQLSFAERMLLNNRTNKALIAMNSAVAHGLDHPNDKINWVKIVSNGATISPTDEPEQAADPIEANIEKKTGKSNRKNAVHPLDQYYPDWEASFVATQNASTICIPPCADVGNAYTDKQESSKSGREAERLLVDAIAAANVGGILITGVKSREYLKYALTQGAKMHHNEKEFAAIQSKAFEIDAIFIHANYGIILCECKSVIKQDGTKLTDDKKFNEAIGQLEKIKKAIAYIYKYITTDELNPSILRCAVAMPNSMICDEEKANFEENNANFHVWDTADLQLSNFSAKMQTYATSPASLSSNIVKNLKALAKATVACRSVCYISLQHNALEVHDQISRQLHLKISGTAKAVKQKDASQQEPKAKYSIAFETDTHVPIYFNGEQLSLIEAEDRLQIISGPPGTGKTVILLLKALISARKRNFAQKIRIISSNTHLLPKLRRFFEQNLTAEDNWPIIGNYFPPDATDDDIFCDEMMPNEDAELVLKKRTVCKGLTLISMTGSIAPTSISEITDWLEQIHCTAFKHTALLTVFRGSQHIIAKWKSFFNDSIVGLKIGHQISGFKVGKKKVVAFIDMMKLLVEEMRQFMPANSNKLNHMAVITDNDTSVPEIKAFLAASSIPCGSIANQVANANVVAVDFNTSCLSYEWPVVFVLQFGSYCYKACDEMIACSRAIVKLIIIKRDNKKILKSIETSLAKCNRSISILKYNEFCEIVSKGRRDVGADEISCGSGSELFDLDLFAAIIRCNYCPEELKKFSPFAKCSSFSDALNVISRDRKLAEFILFAESDSLHSKFYHNMYLLGAMAIDQKHAPKPLKFLWKDEGETAIAERWNICVTLIKRIFDILAEFSRFSLDDLQQYWHEQNLLIRGELGKHWVIFARISLIITELIYVGTGR